ncbi:MAG TPA: hypothetical protein VH274_03145 [Mycobacteriales bacterium]|nr:hypothetical protein [Mycobacteriales bacterium]
MTHRRWTVPLSVAVVVAGVVLLALWLARGGSSSNLRSSARPHVLHLASANTEATAMSASSGVAADQAPPGSAPYTLTGTLPPGTPDDQPLWRLRSATADDAQAVADALQLAGTPTRLDGGWVLRDTDNRLLLRDDGSWSYGMDCSPDTPVSDEDINMGCATASGVAIASPGAEPVPVPSPPAGPTEAQARSVAGHVFERLGMTDPTVVVYRGDPMSTVQASPSVGGMTSSSWFTTVQVDGVGDVVSADGWLTSPDRGADYPVISARAAFDLLQSQPRPALMLCAQRPDGKPGCADIPPTEVTGATLGVMLDQDNGHPVLVPAWLFSIKGQDDPVAQIAIDPSYLGPAPTPSVEPGQPVDEPAARQ